LFLLNYMLIISKFTLFVCVWRWSCDVSHGNRWFSKWCYWCVAMERGLAWEFWIGIFYYVFFIQSVYWNL